MFTEKPLLGTLEVLRLNRKSTLDMMVSDDEVQVVYWLNGLIFIRFAGGGAFAGKLFIEGGTIPGKAGTA